MHSQVVTIQQLKGKGFSLQVGFLIKSLRRRDEITHKEKWISLSKVSNFRKRYKEMSLAIQELITAGFLLMKDPLKIDHNH